MSNRSAQPARWWDLTAAVLLWAVLFTAVRRLEMTHWTDHLGRIQTVAFLAACIGLALGQSRFSPPLAAFFGLAYGLLAVPWQMSLTVGRGLAFPERLAEMGDRLALSLIRLAGQQPVRDPLLFLFLMAALFWGLAAYAGYQITRHASPWRAVIPPGLTALVIQNYDPWPTTHTHLLALYLFLSLLLVARATYLRWRARWVQARTQLPPFSSLDLARVLLPVTALLVLLAWNLPAVASALAPAGQVWQRVSRSWSDAAEWAGHLFASLRASAGIVNDYYTDRLDLGRGSELADTVVLTVNTPPSVPEGVRYYWRARVYDHYEDGQWRSTVEDEPASVGGSLVVPDVAGRWTGVFSYTSSYPLAALYLAPAPVDIGVSARADLTLEGEWVVDVLAVYADPPLRAQTTYQARSALSTVTVAQLRAAGTDYPAWVTARYLQLPPSITPRTLEAARLLTEGLENPYDKAIAITEFLRTAITYQPTVPPPPRDREMLDWFLFDLRQGFCNYSASAGVILLRAAGVPARLAVGFAQGETLADGSGYLVRQRDAHAWVEVYFPGLGWVEFEPTSSQPPIERPRGEEESSAGTGEGGAGEPPAEGGPTGEGGQPQWPDRLAELLAGEGDFLPEEEEAAPARERNDRLAWSIFYIALAGFLTLLIWLLRHRRDLPPLPVLLESGVRHLGLEPPKVLARRAHFARLSPMAQAYAEIDRALRRLGEPPGVAATPYERAAALVRLLPESAAPARSLLVEYEATVYSPRSGNTWAAQQAGKAIRALSRRAMWRRWLRRKRSAD